MADPLVTIVIPTWNRAALVEEAVASVAAQTYRHWELIVVDDGSSDDTIARLESGSDPRIRVVAAAHTGNIARVRNLGAASGSGEWIAFLDSDDLWMPDKLRLQVEALRGRNAGWCYTDYAHVDEAGGRMSQRAGGLAPKPGRVLKALLLEETAACICTVMVSRGLFDAVGGFDESLAIRGDLDFELRIAAAADAVAVPDRLALVREHSGRITGALADPHLDSALVYEKMVLRETDQEILALARARWAVHLAEAGVRSIRSGQPGRGLRLIGRALAQGIPLRHLARRFVGAGLRRWRRGLGKGFARQP